MRFATAQRTMSRIVAAMSSASSDPSRLASAPHSGADSARSVTSSAGRSTLDTIPSQLASPAVKTGGTLDVADGSAVAVALNGGVRVVVAVSGGVVVIDGAGADAVAVAATAEVRVAVGDAGDTVGVTDGAVGV